MSDAEERFNLPMDFYTEEEWDGKDPSVQSKESPTSRFSQPVSAIQILAGTAKPEPVLPK